MGYPAFQPVELNPVNFTHMFAGHGRIWVGKYQGSVRTAHAVYYDLVFGDGSTCLIHKGGITMMDMAVPLSPQAPPPDIVAMLNAYEENRSQPASGGGAQAGGGSGNGN